MIESRIEPGDIDELERRVRRHPPPRHVAVIMDGNGRWAMRRGFPRTDGHRAATRAVRDVVRCAGDLGIQFLTLFSFSAENWRRPRAEVDALMGLLGQSLVTELDELRANNVRLRAIGRTHGLPPVVRQRLDAAVAATSANSGLTLILAINYGGRQELIDAVRCLTERVLAGRLKPDGIDDSEVAAVLYEPDLPAVDLLIRSGGEQRISNFLLWQSAYAELYFAPVLWPDFGRRDLLAALEEFQRRQRRYGGLSGEEG